MEVQLHPGFKKNSSPSGHLSYPYSSSFTPRRNLLLKSTCCHLSIAVYDLTVSRKGTVVGL